MRTLRTILAALGAALLLAGPALAFDGKVVDAATGAPLRDATVVVNGKEIRPGPDGAFRLDGRIDRIQARAPGYRAILVPPTDIDRAGGLVKLTPFKAKGLYLTVYGIGSKSLRDGAMSLIRSGAANALVIDLKGDRGLVPYPSVVAGGTAPASRQVTTIRDLRKLADEMHASGVYLIARIVTFKDNPLATARPDLAIHRADGSLFRDREGMAWTDPFRPEVRAYNIDLAIEAAKAGFDEIQFDYVRFPDSSTRLRLAEASTQANRIAAISGLLAEARRRLAPYNVFLSADVFGYVLWNTDDTGIGQRLPDIMPHVDYLAPMLYPSGFQYGIPGVKNPVAQSYAIVRRSLEQAQARLNVSPKRFRPWLQAFKDYAFDHRLFDADEVAEQIRAASDFGSDGWMLWNARNTYGETGLSAAARVPCRSGTARAASPGSASCS